MSRMVKVKEQALSVRAAQRSGRRTFLKMIAGGVGVATAATLAGCDDDDIVDPDGEMVSLGSGDIGVLNYAYALEQLEAAFYTMVVDNFFSGATDQEMRVLTDLRDHELVHREFYKAALGDDAIPALTVDFSDIDFDERDDVLGQAAAFEDLGVAAYNGAGHLLTNPDFLRVAGKIVSVEARHASAIRDLIAPNSRVFAGNDVVSPETGLGLALPPSQVLPIAADFVVTQIDFSGLPAPANVF